MRPSVLSIKKGVPSFPPVMAYVTRPLSSESASVAATINTLKGNMYKSPVILFETKSYHSINIWSQQWHFLLYKFGTSLSLLLWVTSRNMMMLSQDYCNVYRWLSAKLCTWDTVKCHYNRVQHNMILYTVPQWLTQNINQACELTSGTSYLVLMGELWDVYYEYFGKKNYGVITKSLYCISMV